MTQLSDKLLKKYRHPKLDRVFILGCTSSILNIHAQQQRAFNLVYVLTEKQILLPTIQVAVIGGGIAGLSTASALLVNGIKVTIYERMHELLSLQRGNLTRFVHPNISGWPNKGSGYPITDLPFMNWQAGTVGKVCSELEKQWNEMVALFKVNQLTMYSDCTVTELSLNPNSTKVCVKSKEQPDHYFDYVIMAIGHGIEIDQQKTPSYWHNDDFAQPVLDPKVNTRNYLVSGIGDGALTEVLRLKILDFSQQKFLENVIFDKSFLEAGRDAKAGRWEGVWGSINNNNELHNKFADFFSAYRIRTDTDVVLIGKAGKDWYKDEKAQLLHRLCVKLLEKADKIKYETSSLWSSLMRLYGFSTIKRHGTKSPLLTIRPKLSKCELKKLKKETSLSDQLAPQPFRRNYPKEWLADEFMAAHYEYKYEIGFALTTGLSYELLSKARSILTYLSASATTNELVNLETIPIVRQWRGREFSLSIQFTRIITYRGLTPPELATTLPCRFYEPNWYRTLILRTKSKGLLDHLLDRKGLRYHLYRVYLSSNFPLKEQKEIDRFVNTDTHVFLVDLWKLNNCIEVHCELGMHQAHKLMRVPTLIEVMQNKWTVNAVGGIGWAVQNLSKTNREHQKGNELLNRRIQ